jgi:hypothetical protein
MKREDLRLVHSALTHFVGEMVSSLNDSNLEFETASGAHGAIEKRSDGTYEIFVGPELVYKVEGAFFDICNYDKNDIDMITLYRRLKNIDPETLQFRSQSLYRVVQTSMENIILGMELPICGDIRIRNYHVFYHADHRLKVNLN